MILLAGNGKGFCGGYDLVASAEGMGDGGSARTPPNGGRVGSPLDPMTIAVNHDPNGTWDPMVDYAMMGRNVRAFMSLFHCGKPVVCKVHGFCVAGGTDLALCSDLLVIAADAKIGYPPARVWGSPTTSHWAHRLGAAAREAAAVHRRLPVRHRGASSGARRSRRRRRSSSTSAPRSSSSGSPACRSTNCR